MSITQAILPVAGLGTRFLPWTKVVPKEFLPIGSKPMIALLVEECIDAGITDICFVISPGKEIIPEYFKKNRKWEEGLYTRGKADKIADMARYDAIRFHTVYQYDQCGDGHAILQAAGWVREESVAILFGDDYFTGKGSGIAQLLQARHLLGGEKNGAIIALENISKEETSHYGIVDIEHNHPKNPRLKRLKGLVEKPDPKIAPSTFGIVGRYLIPKGTIDLLPTVESQNGHEIRLIDALIKQLGTIPIYGYECEGIRIDTGTPEGYRKAVQILA